MDLALVLVTVVIVTAFAALFLLGRSLGRPGRSAWGVAWRIVAVAALVALVAAPNHPVVALVAVGVVVVAGPWPRLRDGIAGDPRVRAMGRVVRRHWLVSLVMPVAVALAIDSVAGGRWTPAEAVVGAIELTILGGVVGWYLVPRRRLGPVFGSVTFGLFAGITDRPFLPVTLDAVKLGAAVGVILVLGDLAERVWRRHRPSAPSDA